MAKITLNDLDSVSNETSFLVALNDNLHSITSAIDELLSRDGTAPNVLNADVDMNGHKILNLAAPVDPTDLVRKQDIGSLPSDLNAAVASAVAAAATATSAAAGVTGSAGAIEYTFSTTTTDADPGSGFIRLSSATQNTSTVVRVDLVHRNGTDWTSVLDTWDDSTNTVKGNLRLFNKADPTKFITWNITSMASPSGYRNITGTVVGSSGANPFVNGDIVVLVFTRAGDQGTAGAGTGDMLKANNLSELPSAATARSNLGLVIGTNVQAFDSDLSAVAGLGTTGLIVRTGSGTATTRTLAVGTGLSLTNGDGVSGNPTISITTTTTPRPNVIVEQTAAPNTAGGTIGANVWTTRTINQVSYADPGIVSMGTNQFQLVAGTYYVDYNGQFYSVGNCRNALYNATDAAYVSYSQSGFTNASSGMITSPSGWASFTIAAPKLFEIRAIASSGRSTNGLGIQNNLGGALEVYSTVKIWKVG